MTDWALAVLRVVTGGLLAGHGSQKLLGWFGGPGRRGTAGMMRSQGIRPEPLWAHAAGASELVGGALTAAGALSPLGPLTATAPMVMAVGTVHWGRPIWVTAGGGELALTNLAVLAALGFAGPGRLSVDGALGIRLPRPVVAAAAVATAAGVAAAFASRRLASPPAPAAEAEEPSQPEAELLGLAEPARQETPAG